MGDSYQSKFVKCPFYEKDRLGYIKCEGVNDSCSIQLAFVTEEGNARMNDKKEYLYKYCADKYHSCMIYQMLSRKYK